MKKAIIVSLQGFSAFALYGLDYDKLCLLAQFRHSRGVIMKRFVTVEYKNMADLLAKLEKKNVTNHCNITLEMYEAEIQNHFGLTAPVVGENPKQENDLQIKAYFYPSIVDAKGRKISHLTLRMSNDNSYEADMKEYANFFKVGMPNIPVELNCYYHDNISNTWTVLASLYVLEDRFIKHLSHL